jgi:cobalt-zinc-cadmium efflux system outer membrane protein
VSVRLLAADARRLAAGAGTRFAEGASAAVVAGPRRSDESGDEGDLGLAVEVPLLARAEDRAELARTLADSEPVLATSSSSLAAADVAAAFVEVWLAQATASVRAEDLRAADEWLAVAQRRVEAGADPPYEPTLVAGERDRALVELVAARREAELAWGALAELSDVGTEPRPVALDGMPAARPASAVEATHVPAAIEARRALEVALVAARSGASRSRWALATEVATEGEERFAHVGVTYRLPLRGEAAAIEQQRMAGELEAEREADAALASVRARVAAAEAALASAGPAIGNDALVQAQQALAARLIEGKERASQILPLRRQLLEARLAGLAARAAVVKAAAELHFLSGGSSDAR